ncbi:nitroreductase family protein [Cytobacillus solani]|uniref:NAD(P)H nitroreductase n=1 Tax=Cytobacillus solani TaxID=1637975 RepID=A0A0Q3SF28_9BACI|nr:nitroreductase family protein [Cytobacillus solani]KQL17828.1 NAD(P)H nitroreductase [Cytobacillus solani]USK55642.1 nitroreductase family protein [Cytobacillus solani]
MSPKTDQSVSTVIRERHSVRKYDANYKIAREEIEDILNGAILAPSSSNLQPWRFIIIDNEEVKKELRLIANNQEPIETSSAVIAVLGDKEMYMNIEKVYRSGYEAGFMDEENVNRLMHNANSLYPNISEEVRKNIASFDAGLVSMQLMLIAKEKGYDTVPMGGFDKVKFIERFNVSERYMPMVLIAIGKAAAPPFKTTRIPLKDIAEFI